MIENSHLSQSDIESDSSANLQFCVDIDEENPEFDPNAKIADLTEELSSVKTQFHDALALLNGVDELTKKNEALLQENKKAKGEIDDLQKRLSISLQLNDELSTKIEQEKKDAESYINSESHNLHNQLSQQQQQQQQRIQYLENQNDAINKQIEELKQKNNNNENDISLCLRTASKNLGHNFPSLKDLTSFLQDNNEQSATAAIANDHHQNSSAKSYSEDKILSVIGSLKEKNRENRNIKKKLEQEIINLKNLLQNQQKEADSEIFDLRNKLNDSTTNDRIKQMQFDQKIADLENINSSLMEKLKKQNEKMSFLKQSMAFTPIMGTNSTAATPVANQPSENDIQSLKSLVSELQNGLKKASHTNSKLKKQIASLVAELQKDETQQNQLKKEIASLQEKNDSILTENGDLHNINESLSEEKQSLIQQTQKLLNDKDVAMQNVKQLKSTLANLQSQMTQSRINISNLDNTVNKQKDEIESLLSAKNSMADTLKRQSDSLKEHEEKYVKANEECKTLQFKLSAIQSLKTNQQSEQIPNSSWFCAELPRELCSSIVDIGKNEQQQPAMRVRQVLSVVAKYITNIIEEDKKQFHSNESQMQKPSDILKELVRIINNQIGQPKIVIENLFNDPQILKSIESRFDELTNLRALKDDEKEKVEENIQRVYSILGANSIEDVENEYKKLKQFIDKQSAQIKQLRGGNKEIKMTYNELLAEYEMVKEQAAEEIAKKVAEMDQFRNEKSQKASEYELAQMKIEQLQKEIQRMNDEQQETLSTLENEQQMNTSKLCEKLQGDFMKQIKQKEGDVAAANANTQKALQKIVKLKKRLQLYKNKIVELTKEIASFEEKTEETKKEVKEQCTEELKTSMVKFNDNIEKLKKDSIEKEEEIRKYNVQMARQKSAYKSLALAKQKLEKEKKDFVTRIEAAKQEVSREKKLAESKIKTITLLGNNKYQSEIEELKSAIESQKREIYHFVAEQFRQFYDPRQQVDDDCFKGVINNVKDRLEAYSCQDASIRRALGISSREQIDDYINRFVALKSLNLSAPSIGRTPFTNEFV